MVSKLFRLCTLLVVVSFLAGIVGDSAGAFALAQNPSNQALPLVMTASRARPDVFGYLQDASPRISVSPLAFQYWVGAGRQDAQTLNIANIGNLPLEWSLYEGARTAGQGMGLFNEHIIYAQMENIYLGPGQVSIQDLAFPDRSSQAADDFEVPETELWEIEHVDFWGVFDWQNGELDTFLLNLFFYSDEGAKPGTEIYAAYGLEVGEVWGGVIRASLPDPLELGAGRYWVSVQPVLDSETTGTWFWLSYSQQSWSQYHWREPGNGNGTGCTDWSPGSSCGGTEFDLAFVLLGGSEYPCEPVEDFDWLRVSPSSGTAQPGASAGVQVNVDAAGLALGSYQARLCLLSNDPWQPVIQLPVDLEVAAVPYKVVLTAEVPEKSALPGSQVEFDLLLTNLSALPDTIDLAVTGNTWAASLSLLSAQLAPHESKALKATVNVPAGALAEETGSLVVRAVSRSEPGVSAQVSLTARAETRSDLSLSPTEATRIAGPGKTAVFNLTLTNTGNAANTFSLLAQNEPGDPNIWPVTLPDPVTIQAGETAEVEVQVLVPEQAVNGDEDGLVVEVGALGALPASRQARLRTIAQATGPLLEIQVSSLPAPVEAGETLTITIVVKNTSQYPTSKVVVENPLLPGMVFMSASAGCSEAGDMVTCLLGSLQPAQTSPVTITVKLNRLGSLVNRATAISSESPQVEAETIIEVIPRRLYLPVMKKP